MRTNTQDSLGGYGRAWPALVAVLAVTALSSLQALPAETKGEQEVVGQSKDSGAPGAIGQNLYQQHCAACHGVKGEGDGPAAVWLYPKPRRFTSGLFKIKSTPAGFLPTDEDLFQTVTRGMPGSSMPSFTYLNEQERRDVVQFVKTLTAYVDPEGKRINYFEEAIAKGMVGTPIQVPPEPPLTVQALALGQEVY